VRVYNIIILGGYEVDMPTPIVTKKTFAPEAAVLVRHICHYLNKYNAQIVATINAVVTDSSDKALLLAFFATVNAACLVFNKYWPPEQT
jgi:hypothetical protein